MDGLSRAEAEKLILQYGYNQLPASKPKNILHIAFEVIKEPMFLLLIGCATLYILLGDYREGFILLSTTFVIIFISFYQNQKTEKALDALKKLSSPRAMVRRDGVESRIAGKDVVPGDIMILHEGDRIAADAIMIISMNLVVDESMLTGESVPVNKYSEDHENSAENMVFGGTMVVQGRGEVKVLKTGSQTKFGQIGKSLESIGESSTPLQKEMKKLIRNLFIAGGLISIAVILAFYFTRGNFIQALLNGIASAMAILPEEFSVVMTVFMALGSWRLSKKNVLTRKPTAIETLGSATVLCTDKTGTLTQNKMVIAALYDGDKIWKQSEFTAQKTNLLSLMNVGMKASPKDSIDPMEKAIFETFKTLSEGLEKQSQRLKEYPLSKEFFAITCVEKVPGKTELLVSSKGAPEVILGMCNLNKAEKDKQMLAVQQMAEKGYRVLGLAQNTISEDKLPEKQSEFKLIFRGLIAFEDPIREEVPQAISECKRAGIKVIMITGDYPFTAQSIALQIGMSGKQEIITGDELNKLNDEELKTKINRINIFARVVPEQKLRIVEALKANHEVVAMTGDGVNDAPALKAADIGIAMGNKGTDVAREASSLVLMDDNFASIVSAIRLGRRIFDNLQKAMSYIMAIHIPIIGLALIPAFMPMLPILLMPLHIVFMELIIDPVCSIAFESEKEEKGIMERPPRNSNEAFFGKKRIWLSVLEGTILLASVIIIYFISANMGHSENETRAITFSTLILGNIFLILTSLSKTRSLVAVLREGNKSLLIILSVAMVLLIAVNSIPALRIIFNFDYPGIQHFAPPIIASGFVLITLELLKYYNLKKNRKKILSTESFEP
jgi:Ca2+-transporting ATPase